MKTTLCILVIVVLTQMISSCGNCRCIDFEISPKFIGFALSDVDTVIIRKYTKGNNFSTLIDTAFFDDKTSFQPEKRNDTIGFPSRKAEFSIEKNYDWIIYLPSINRSFKVDNIVSPQVSLPCPGKTICINPVNSLNIDGTVSYPEYFSFFLKK